MPNVAMFFGAERLPHALHFAANAHELRQDCIGQGTMLVELGAAEVGDLVELLAPVSFDCGKTDLFKVSECRIDHARTRRVEAFRGFFQRFDDLVAMSGSLREQSQDDQLQLAGTQFAPAEEAASAEAPAVAE